MTKKLLQWAMSATEVSPAEITEITEKPDAWYTLDGRKLDSKPAQRGIYINNGRMVLIK